MADELTIGEDMQSVCGEEPTIPELLLHAQRKLLHQRVVRIRSHGEDANTAGLVRTAEWSSQRR